MRAGALARSKMKAGALASWIQGSMNVVDDENISERAISQSLLSNSSL
jgi:hypothetical protein